MRTEPVVQPLAHEKNDSGAVMVLFAFMLTGLILMAAFAVDVGAWYARRTELQTAVDSAALAAAPRLADSDPAAAYNAARDAVAANGFSVAPPGSAPLAGQVSLSTCPSYTGSRAVAMCAGLQSDQFAIDINDDDVPAYLSKIVIDKGPSIRRGAVARYDDPVRIGSPENYFGYGLESGTVGIEPVWAQIGGYCAAAEDGDLLSSRFDGNNRTGAGQPTFGSGVSREYWCGSNSGATNVNLRNGVGGTGAAGVSYNPLFNQVGSVGGWGASPAAGAAGYSYLVDVPSTATRGDVQVELLDAAFWPGPLPLANRRFYAPAGGARAATPCTEGGAYNFTNAQYCWNAGSGTNAGQSVVINNLFANDLSTVVGALSGGSHSMTGAVINSGTRFTLDSNVPDRQLCIDAAANQCNGANPVNVPTFISLNNPDGTSRVSCTIQSRSARYTLDKGFQRPANSECGGNGTRFCIRANEVPGQYRLRVNTVAPGQNAAQHRSQGVNAFAVRVTKGCTVGATVDARCTRSDADLACPTIAAEGWMSLQARFNGASGQFYLAQVKRINNGKLFRLQLWDPGEGADSIQILDYDSTTPLPFDVFVMNPATPDNVPATPTLSNVTSLDVSGTHGGLPCAGVAGATYTPNTRASNSQWNGCLLLLQTRAPGINVPSGGGPYYYRIRYQRSGSASPVAGCSANFCDSTTWRVQVVDSPVALIE